MEKSAGSAERGIRMDERDVFISKMRKELEDKEEENRALAARLEIVRQELAETEIMLASVRDCMEEMKKHYEELREKHAELIAGVQGMINREKGR